MMRNAALNVCHFANCGIDPFAHATDRGGQLISNTGELLAASELPISTRIHEARFVRSSDGPSNHCPQHTAERHLLAERNPPDCPTQRMDQRTRPRPNESIVRTS